MKPQLRILLSIVLCAALFSASRASADAINIAFTTGVGLTGTGGYLLAPDNGNWNNFNGASGSSSSGLVDSTGTATTAQLTTYSAGQTGANGLYPGVSTQTAILLTNFLDSQPGSPATLTVTGLPTSITGTGTSTYEVAVYVNGSTSGNSLNLSNYLIAPSGSAAQSLGVDAGGTGTPYPGGDGLVLANQSDTPGNYFVFTNLKGSSFTLTANDLSIMSGNEAVINGISIFGVGSSGGGGSTPEPASMVLMALGALGLAGLGVARRRRAQKA